MTSKGKTIPFWSENFYLNYGCVSSFSEVTQRWLLARMGGAWILFRISPIKYTCQGWSWIFSWCDLWTRIRKLLHMDRYLKLCLPYLNFHAKAERDHGESVGAIKGECTDNRENGVDLNAEPTQWKTSLESHRISGGLDIWRELFTTIRSSS